MKPLKSELEDAESLRELGSASVQIVHDIKNQLNGLKLYATFLRKRFEKGDRPADELETIGKLIAGLERAANEMNVLVRMGRPLELRLQPGTDLARVLAAAAEGISLETQAGSYEGRFDTNFLSDALKNITAGILSDGNGSGAPNPPQISLRREETDGAPVAVIEWRGIKAGAETEGGNLFSSFTSSQGLRMALAAKVIKAHGGEVAQEAGVVRARLPLAR